MFVKTTAEVEELMIKIENDKADVAKKKAVVEVEEAASAKKATECKEIADSAQAGLAEALPALELVMFHVPSAPLTSPRIVVDRLRFHWARMWLS